MLLPYWNRIGDVHYLEPYPFSFEDWAAGSEISPDRQTLHDDVASILHSKIIQTSCRAKDMNTTLDATLADGRSVIVRQRHSHPSDAVLEHWSISKFQGELQLMRWLRMQGKIPIADILGYGSNFSIQEKMRGLPVGLQWHSWSTDAKNRFMRDYVDVILNLFHLRVPRLIGSALCDLVDGTPVLSVGPRIGPSPICSSSDTFDDASELFRFLISVKRKSIEPMSPSDQVRAEQVLSAIESRVGSLLQRLSDPVLSRCVLTHADLHSYNILADEKGMITAILDWEINYIQPAIIGVGYPEWLSDDGPSDPDFASAHYWWDESPNERRRLRAYFEQLVLASDQAFYRCLTEGRDMRSIMAWLINTSPDPGFERFDSWIRSRLS